MLKYRNYRGLSQIKYFVYLIKLWLKYRHIRYNHVITYICVKPDYFNRYIKKLLTTQIYYFSQKILKIFFFYDPIKIFAYTTNLYMIQMGVIGKIMLKCRNHPIKQKSTINLVWKFEHIYKKTLIVNSLKNFNFSLWLIKF